LKHRFRTDGARGNAFETLSIRLLTRRRGDRATKGKPSWRGNAAAPANKSGNRDLVGLVDFLSDIL